GGRAGRRDRARGGRARGGGRLRLGLTSLLRGLDDDERIAVGIAQPEHRRGGGAPTGDLVVAGRARSPQRSVIGVDVRGVEADAGLAAARLLVLRRGRERDRRLATW